MDDLNDARYDLLDERLDHYLERLEALEDRKAVRRAMALEAAFEILMYFHHG